MELQKIIYLIRKYFIHLAVWPMLLAIAAFFLSKDAGKMYMSKTLIYVGIISGYDIETSTETRSSNYIQIANSFDNLINIIKARNTIETVSIRLLAQHLKTDGNNTEIMSKKHHKEFLASVPPYILKRTRTMTDQEIYKYLTKSMLSDTGWANIRFNGSGYYSFKALSSISVRRKSSSDLCEISYTTNDPGVSKSTLDIVNDVFIDKYKSMRQSQIGNVAQFFDEKLERIQKSLKEKEDSLLNYKLKNNIVDYDNQANQLVSKRDQIESMILDRTTAFQAAKSSLAQVEKQLQSYTSQLSKNEQISKLKSSLSKISSELMKEKLKGDDASKTKLKRLEAEQIRVSDNMKAIVLQIGGTSEIGAGLEQNELLSEWLRLTILYEDTKAQLQAIQNFSSQFERKFQKFAPIGAGLKRIEREIAVLEDEYLSLMNVYNQSKLKEKNLEKSSNISAIDPPFFPLQPVKSGRLANVILAFMAGLMVILVTIFIKEILIVRINSFETANRLIGGEILGMYPAIASTKKVVPSVLRAEDMIAQKILSGFKLSNKTSYNAILLSIHENDGRKHISEMVGNRLSGGVNEVSFTEYGIDNDTILEPYVEPGIHFHSIMPLTEKMYSPFVLNKFDCIIMVISAEKKWSLMKKDLVNVFKDSYQGKLYVVINKVDMLYFKTVYS